MFDTVNICIIPVFWSRLGWNRSEQTDVHIFLQIHIDLYRSSTYIILGLYWSQSILSKSKFSGWVKLTLPKSLFKTQLQYRLCDCRSEHLFRKCSVATNLVKSSKNSFQIAVLQCCAVSANCGIVLYSLISLFSNTATSSARSEYWAVPEHSSRNKETEL